MARQRGVVGLDVHLEVLVQAVFAQETDGGGGVEVILVLHGLLRLRLDVEVAGEADLPAVIPDDGEQGGDVFLLQRHVGVEQRLIALASAPEHIALRAQFDRVFNSFLGLRRREAEHVRTVAAARAVHEAGIAEHVAGGPKALDIRAFRLFKNIVGDLVKPLVRDVDILRILRDDVHVMEAVILDAQLLHKLNARVHLGLRMLHGARDGAEALVRRALSEHIDAVGAEVVPPGHGKGKMLLHGFSENHAGGIIILERERVLAVPALVFDLRDVGKKFAHNNCSFCSVL